MIHDCIGLNKWCLERMKNLIPKTFGGFVKISINR